jgi:Zinc knuckle
MRNRTFQEYYADFRRIVADIPAISEKEQIRRLEKGLTREMKVAMIHGDVDETRIELYASRCRRVYRRLKKTQTNPFSNKPTDRESSTKTTSDTGATSSSGRNRTQNTPRPTTAQSTNSKDTASATTATNAPARPKPTADATGLRLEGKCYDCGEAGHIARFCPKKATVTEMETELQELQAEVEALRTAKDQQGKEEPLP